MQKISFAAKAWEDSGLVYAYTRRFPQTPVFTQHFDHVENRADPEGPGGYENISLLTERKYQAGTTVTSTMEFEGLGAPIIMFSETMERDEDGTLRFDDYFEVVLYKNGINVWRHFRTDGVCSWHKRLGIQYPVAAGEKHLLSVEVKERMLCITLDGQTNFLRVEDLFESFCLGVTACEGIARLYEFSVES